MCILYFIPSTIYNFIQNLKIYFHGSFLLLCWKPPQISQDYAYSILILFRQHPWGKYRVICNFCPEFPVVSPTYAGWSAKRKTGIFDTPCQVGEIIGNFGNPFRLFKQQGHPWIVTDMNKYNRAALYIALGHDEWGVLHPMQSAITQKNLWTMK